MSPTTECYDRGQKFQHYRELKTLQEYILIAQDSPHIERFVRQEKGFWRFSEVRGVEVSLELSSIGCTLNLAEVYERISFASEQDEGQRE